MKEHDTIVVGAGVSGLSYAFCRGEADVLVLEAAPYAGGLLRTLPMEGATSIRFEEGAEALSTTATAAIEVLEATGVAARRTPETAAKRYLVHKGRLIPLPGSPPALAATPLLSWRGKLALLREPFRGGRAHLDGSIAEFGHYRLGKEATERLLDPLVRGIHGGDPKDLSLAACFPKLVTWMHESGSLFRALRAKSKESATSGAEKPGLMRPVGGFSAWMNAMAKHLGERVRTGVSVQALEQRDDAWIVSTSSGPLRSRRVVLATPLGPTVGLLRGCAPVTAVLLDEMKAEGLVSVVHAYRRRDVEHPLDGFGYLVPNAEGLSHLGTLFSSTIDPDVAPADVVVLRTLIGGAGDPRAVEASDENLLARVEREVGQLLGLKAKPLATWIGRYPDVLPRFDLRHPARVRELETSLPARLELLGNYRHGVGVATLVERARDAARAHRSSVEQAQ